MDIVQENASRETFWSLLSDKQYSIHIPRIQRDYAQGRTEAEPTQIRQKFIKDIFDALINKKNLDINFIYGNINKGLEFIPIDGQQRLTTLFLLHWYFANWSNKLTEENKKILCKFQYETRFVSGEFCQRLVEKVGINLKELNESETDLIDRIKDYSWFFSAYERDATIKSMLVVLQEIHNEIKRIEDKSVVNDFFDILISKNCPITFLFLDLANLGLTDEIYIKMNARGKALTKYENFKAQLSSYLYSKDKSFSEYFIKELNGRWSSFFWHEEYRPVIKNALGKEIRATIFDDQIMGLIRFVMWNEYIVNTDMDKRESDWKKIRSYLEAIYSESDLLFFNRLFVDEFKTTQKYKSEVSCVNEKSFYFLDRLMKVLDKRKKDQGTINFINHNRYQKNFIDEESLFCKTIKTIHPSCSYVEQVLIYAEFCFLVKYANDDGSFDKENELTDWIRFISNLTKATQYNSYEDCFRSIRGIRRLIDEGEALHIYDYASKICRREYKNGSGFGFYENQVMEECIKAILIAHNNWRNVIIDAEKSFLDNQIASVLSFSGIWNFYQKIMDEYEIKNPERTVLPDAIDIFSPLFEDVHYIESFKTYLKKINLIFDSNKIKEDVEKDCLLRRALLTFGGAKCYMLPPNKSVSSFLDVDGRDYSFKRLLRDDNNGCRDYFKELLDAINPDENIAEQLETIIQNASFDRSNKWKQYFVQMPELFTVFKKHMFIYREGERILLLEKTKTSSTNREYYSFVLYLKTKALGYNVSYQTNFSEGTEKFLKLNDKSGNEVQIVYKKADNSETYSFFARKKGEILLNGNMDEMLNYIKNNALKN